MKIMSGLNSSSNESFTQKNEFLSLYYREVAKSKPLTSEEAFLAKRIRNDDREALNISIQANLKFVVSVCRNYQNQGLPLIDLINEGNIGLIRAAWRFDENRKFKIHFL